MKDIPETREDLVRGYRFDIIMDILLIFLGVIDRCAAECHYRFWLKYTGMKGHDICNLLSSAQKKK